MECRTINCVAVTGATSSIGTFFVEECIRRDIKVVAIFRFSSANAARVPDHPLVMKIDCELAGLKKL